jgi:hypothetical protein
MEKNSYAVSESSDYTQETDYTTSIDTNGLDDQWKWVLGY